jgi:hypothetical protein
MADAPVGSQAGSAGSTGDQQGEAKPQFADAASVAKIETMLQTLQHQLNGLSAAQRAAAKKEVAANQEPTEQQAVTLKGLKAELDIRDERIRDKAIRTEIRGYAKDKGITAEFLPYFEAFVEKQHRAPDDQGRMKWKGLTTTADDQVAYQDEFGETHPFSFIGDKILNQAGGRNLIPPVRTPGQVGGSYQQGVNRGSQVPDISTMTVDQMIQNPDLANAAMLQKAAQFGMVPK